MELSPERARALLAKAKVTPDEMTELLAYVRKYIDDRETRGCCMEGCEATVEWQIPLCQAHMASGAAFSDGR